MRDSRRNAALQLVALGAVGTAVVHGRATRRRSRRRGAGSRTCSVARSALPVPPPMDSESGVPDLDSVSIDQFMPPDIRSEPMRVEPAVVLSVQEDVVVIRAGQQLGSTIEGGGLLKFSGGATGVILSWKEEVAVAFAEPGSVKLGENVICTGALTTAAGTALLGRIVDEEGVPWDEKLSPEEEESMSPHLTFARYAEMGDRDNQYRPLVTGVLGIDFAVPIGRGQTMLIQGTDKALDKAHLWPDLMRVKGAGTAEEGDPVAVCVCEDMEQALDLTQKLQEHDALENSIIVVPRSPNGVGSGTVAMNAGVAIAEALKKIGMEALVMMDLEPMCRVWGILAAAAGAERRLKGLVDDEADEAWVEMQGTMVTESISERRKFWFAFISRAVNALEGGSVSILAWLWEQQESAKERSLKALQLKLERAKNIPRIPDAAKEKMIAKIEAEAIAAGVSLEELAAKPVDAYESTYSGGSGVPNWEVEELKSISDGHILLTHPSMELAMGAAWGWHIDVYKSLPRLGTDALHKGLIAVEAHIVRLKMLQGRDRANFMKDTMGAKETIDDRPPVEIRFLELLLHQPCDAPRSVQEMVMLVAVAAFATPNVLQMAGCNLKAMDWMASKLLESGAGQDAVTDVQEEGTVTERTLTRLRVELARWGEDLES